MCREADRDNKREFVVGDLGWRWWKRSGALDQVERRGIEKGRPGALYDPAAHQVAMPIDAEGETDYTLDAAGLRRILLKPRQARHQRFLPTSGRRRFRCRGG